MKFLSTPFFLALASISSAEDLNLRHLKSKSKSKSNSGGSKSNSASISTGDYPETTQICWGLQPLEASFDVDDDDFEERKVSIIDMGTVHMDSGESLMVEVTATTLLYTSLEGDGSSSFDVEADQEVRAVVQLYQGCVSRSDCAAKNVAATEPSPAVSLPLHVQLQYLERDDDYGVSWSDNGFGKTSTAKFFFPATDLSDDNYWLSLKFLVKTEGYGYTYEPANWSGSVELGPHLIEVTKMNAASSACNVVDIVDDDDTSVEALRQDSSATNIAWFGN